MSSRCCGSESRHHSPWRCLPSADKPNRENNCPHPVTGVNLNELFGVPEQLVAACGGPTVGEHWRPYVGYFGAEASDAVYPRIVPLYASPLRHPRQDLDKVVVDGGARAAKPYTFTPTDEDAFRTDLTIHDINPTFPDLPGFIIIPRMAPLSSGHHTYELFWVLTAPHCDGPSIRRRKLPPRRRAHPGSASV